MNDSVARQTCLCTEDCTDVTPWDLRPLLANSRARVLAENRTSSSQFKTHHHKPWCSQMASYAVLPILFLFTPCTGLHGAVLPPVSSVILASCNTGLLKDTGTVYTTWVQLYVGSVCYSRAHHMAPDFLFWHFVIAAVGFCCLSWTLFFDDPNRRYTCRKKGLKKSMQVCVTIPASLHSGAPSFINCARAAAAPASY